MTLSFLNNLTPSEREDIFNKAIKEACIKQNALINKEEDHKRMTFLDINMFTKGLYIECSMDDESDEVIYNLFIGDKKYSGISIRNVIDLAMKENE